MGRSSNPKRRLREIQTGSPYEVRLILVVEDQGHRERKIHAALRGYESQGYRGEWFIEPGLASLPEDLYDLLDLDMVNTWWETERGPVDPVGPPVGWLSRRRTLSDPGVPTDD